MMTNVSTAELPAVAPAEAGERIARDLTCACGYNLRGLAPDGRCPECNAEVAAAVRWHAQPFATPAPLRRMAWGLTLVLAAHLAWGILMVHVGREQSGDRHAYHLAGASGPKTFIVAPALVFGRSQTVSRVLVPACLAASLLGLWLLTTPHVRGRATSLRRPGLALHWTAIAAAAGASAALPLASDHGHTILPWTILADALVGTLWGIYLAGVARAVGRAKWLRVGGWIVAIGSAVFGALFAGTFLFFRWQWRYFEPWLWTSLTAWAAVGLFCSALLVFARHRLKRELRQAVPDLA